MTDLYTLLGELKSSIDDILRLELYNAANASVSTLAKATLSELLVQLGMEAIEAVEDFEYGGYRDLFYTMLTTHPHIKIEGYSVTRVFNEDKAGTFYDLIQGMVAAGGHTGTDRAPAVWRFKIYPNEEKYIPTVNERLSYWEGLGNRAPFWMIINYGTYAFEDPERAYPTVTGQHFVEKLESLARPVMERAKYIYLRDMAESFGAEVEDIVNNPKRGATVNIAKIPVMDELLTIQESSAGNIFYKVGKRSLSFNQAKAAIRRAYR